MKTITWLKQLLEWVGGVRESGPPGLNLKGESLWWSLWWFLLILIISVFCGQSSKFIYIDF